MQGRCCNSLSGKEMRLAGNYSEASSAVQRAFHANKVVDSPLQGNMQWMGGTSQSEAMGVDSQITTPIAALWDVPPMIRAKRLLPGERQIEQFGKPAVFHAKRERHAIVLDCRFQEGDNFLNLGNVLSEFVI